MACFIAARFHEKYKYDVLCRERKDQALEKGEPPPDFKVNAQFMEVGQGQICMLQPIH